MMAMKEEALNIEEVRGAFPAVHEGEQIFLDNAGGSQVLHSVSTSIRRYLEETNVQLGATYAIAKKSTQSYDQGLASAAAFINASPDEIALGSSTTQLYANLSQILDFPPQSELVVSQIDHEANISAWVRLARLQGHKICWWKPAGPATDGSMLLTPENLRPLLSPRTKLVTCTHASNILGGIHDVKAIADCVHREVPEAMLCVDGVALAPHRAVDVKDLGVDFYAFSWYKVYGPHIACLYASTEAKARLGSLGHFFHLGDSLMTKIGLAGASYELIAGINPVLQYLGGPVDQGPSGKWKAIAQHEEDLQKIVLDYLNSKPDIVVYGHKSADSAKRVPVISFTVNGRKSGDIVEAVGGRFGFRNGHMYSSRLVNEILGLDEDGVIRVSLLHYNSKEEVQSFVKSLDSVLQSK